MAEVWVETIGMLAAMALGVVEMLALLVQTVRMMVEKAELLVQMDVM